MFGAGAQASGQAHVTAGWEKMSPDARVGLVEDLLRVAVLTGQLQHVKVRCPMCLYVFWGVKEFVSSCSQSTPPCP